MEPSSSSYSGAGGKISRRPFRPRISPYSRPNRPADRPTAAAAEGWFSKLVVRPVSWVLPSFLTSYAAADPDPNSALVAENEQEDMPPLAEIEQEGMPPLAENEQEDDDEYTTPNHENQFNESRVPAASVETGLQIVEFKNDEVVEGKRGDTHDRIGLTEIEQRLTHKTYTRDESARLIELLRSRTIGIADDNRHAADSTVDATETRYCQAGSRTSIKEDASDHQITLKTFEPFQAHDVSSSPIDIAKAYMQGQKSTSVYDLPNGALVHERKLAAADVSSLSPSSAVKSPICWPGAVVNGEHGYLTPQYQRGRTAHRSYPRTPYSGAVFSRSTSKGVGERSNLPLAGWKQSHTSVFGRKTINSLLNDGLVEADSTLHMRQKNMATAASEGAGPSNVSAFPWSGTSSMYQNRERGSSKGFYRSIPPLSEDKSRSTVGSTVHPQSSRMAQKILEHLDRAVSPKEKSQELHFTFNRPKITEFSTSNDCQDKKKQNSKSVFGKIGLFDEKDTGTFKNERPDKISVPFTSKSHEEDQSPPPKTTEFACSIAASESFQVLKSQGHSGGESDFKPTSERVETFDCGSGFNFPVSPASNMFSKPPPALTMTQSRAASRALPPGAETIQTFKFGNSEVRTFDNGFGFTFPAPPASNVLSEPPPTPTMSPARAANRSLPTVVEPTFNFSNPKADNRLVFSFGSTVNSAITEVVTPTFKFGSDKKRELSFKLVGKDAICY